MVVSRMTDQVGRVLGGRYRLIAPIGSGASALVFLADDTRLRRRVAVKVLHQGLADDEAFIRRFRAEAHSAAALNHPNVLSVYDWGEDDREPYLVTEYLGGGSLRGMLDAGRRLSVSQALVVGLEAARALDYAHKRGFIHRDIKPANLLFGEEGRLRIGDFGLARALAEAAWTEPAGAMIGTARYACPEQARGQLVDGKGDVYALGLVLIEAVTGRVPFTADTTIATLMGRVDMPVDVPEELGPLRSALERAGRPDPAERPDAGELATHMLASSQQLDRPAPLPLVGATALAGDIAVVDRDPTELPPSSRIDDAGAEIEAEPGPDTEAGEPDAPDAPPRKRRRRWLVALLVVLAVLALGSGAAFAWVKLRVPTHKVPTLVGLTEQQAREQAQANHWNVRKVDGREDGSVVGNVIAQDPEAGKSLAEDKTVTITVSLGNTLVSVPTDLVGKSVADATAELQATSLDLGTQTPQHDESAVAGTILLVDPATPPQLPKGEKVNVTVSDGPAPRTVPQLSPTMTFEQASQALAAVQLVGVQSDDLNRFSDAVPAGQIIGTDPPAGADVSRDSKVKVIFSKGPQPVPIPDVRDKSVAEATSILQAAGFPVLGVTGSPSSQVLFTDPPPGEPHAKGTGVTLFTRR
ncbi:MAG TPA: PASTA domain-containing protein [Acidimicrobiales bacterium]|nr:PASTA domain-containing protein [Acidimicrobiales bacterium]